MSTDAPKLDDQELLTLCGTLLRAIRLELPIDPVKSAMLVDIVAEVVAASTLQATMGAYREPGIVAQLPDEARAAAVALIERAAKHFADDASLRAALVAVTRPDVQRLISDALFSLAAVDTVGRFEQKMLDELDTIWSAVPSTG